MKTLYIIRGLPGSGKTTLANKLTKQAIAADDYPGLYIDGVYQQHLQKESHAWCLEEIKKCMADGHENVAVHNTFTTCFYMQPYIDAASQYGYAVQVIHSEGVILPLGKFAISEHNVPANIYLKMLNGWEPSRSP